MLNRLYLDQQRRTVNIYGAQKPVISPIEEAEATAFESREKVANQSLNSRLQHVSKLLDGYYADDAKDSVYKNYDLSLVIMI